MLKFLYVNFICSKLLLMHSHNLSIHLNVVLLLDYYYDLYLQQTVTHALTIHLYVALFSDDYYELCVTFIIIIMILLLLIEIEAQKPYE